MPFRETSEVFKTSERCPLMGLGARGSCGSLIATNSEFTLTFFEHAAHGRWTEAFAMQQVVAKFFEEAAAFIEDRGEGTIDPVLIRGCPSRPDTPWVPNARGRRTSDGPMRRCWL